MRLVVGLGNPGARYADTRHNVGFQVVDWLADRWGVALSERCFEGRFGRGWYVPVAGDSGAPGPIEVALLQPETFMNLSGDAVAEAVSGLGIEDVAANLVVVFDDVDLPFGRLRLRPAGSAGGHNGLAHVLARLSERGEERVARLRFGVGRPERGETRDHVLTEFSREERRRLPERLAAAGRAIETLWVEGMGPAMSRFNRDPDETPAIDAAER